MLIRFAMAGAAVLLAQHAEAETVRYALEINVTWSAETHPNDFFPDAHLTRLVGATHNERFVLFGDGRTASSGLQSVAERGRTAILMAEMEDAKERERLGEIFHGDPLGPVPGKMIAEISATEEYSLLSFATMIAPSPDWFTGAASVPLFENGAWKDQVEVTIWPWDAGTDSGTTWLAENEETQPRQSIRLITTPHFLGADGLPPMGTAILRRIE
jgi:hypothetical protein